VSESVRFRFRSRWQIAMREAQLPSFRLLVGLTLSTWARPDGSDCRPSVERIGKATGLARSTVLRHLGALEAGGWIGRQAGGGRGRATTYSLMIPASIEALLEALLGAENRPTSGTVSSDLGEKLSQFPPKTVSISGLNRPTSGTPGIWSLIEPEGDEVADFENRPTSGTVSSDGPPGKSQESAVAPWQLLGYTWAEFIALPLAERQAILSRPQDRAAGGTA
jgi:DNA-binding MarR family transcriptional regulator